jgi:CRISPR/Cas system CSM-associated protein Csm3 (group 7 of RAMP superfamily)
MSQPHNTQLIICKLIIETQSPMAINTGKRETGFDTELARDINGLPMIPATAIAGVWGHLVEQLFGINHKEQWFGSTESKSLMTISNGYLLDSQGQGVENYRPQDQITTDCVLNLCAKLRPHHRERVAINDRGVAKETGKFDQILLPKGARFAINLQWTLTPQQQNDAVNPAAWIELLTLWNHTQFAFGSSTRNGLGKVNIVQSQQKTFDLSVGPSMTAKITAFRRQAMSNDKGLTEQLNQKTDDIFYALLPVKALDNWRCGSGQTLLSKASTDAHTPNIISYSEPVIEWQQDKAEIIPNVAVLCGSSIKGILAHRIAFHLRKHQQVWAETLEHADHDMWQTRPIELSNILGDAETTAGQFYVEDTLVEYKDTVVRNHNSIDRFTGGVRKGALYSEELLYQPSFEVRLAISAHIVLSPELKQALIDTIQDLELGLLPFGAGSGRGTSLVQKDLSQSHRWQCNFDTIPTQATPTKIAAEA